MKTTSGLLRYAISQTIVLIALLIFCLSIQSTVVRFSTTGFVIVSLVMVFSSIELPFLVSANQLAKPLDRWLGIAAIFAGMVIGSANVFVAWAMGGLNPMCIVTLLDGDTKATLVDMENGWQLMKVQILTSVVLNIVFQGIQLAKTSAVGGRVGTPSV